MLRYVGCCINEKKKISMRFWYFGNTKPQLFDKRFVCSRLQLFGDVYRLAGSYVRNCCKVYHNIILDKWEQVNNFNLTQIE